MLSLFIVHEAYQLSAPGHILLPMLANVAVDGALGAVPVVGDAGATCGCSGTGWSGKEWRSEAVHDLRW
jgi:hypothetical protein